MGVKQSKKRHLTEDKKISLLFEDKLKSDAKLYSRLVKVLLLGAGDSGKSTLFKQIKIIHGGGFTQNERLKYKYIVYTNAIELLKTIIIEMNQLGVALNNQISREDARKIIFLEFTTGELSEELINCMARLWKDSDLKSFFVLSKKYAIDDTAK